MHLRSFDQRLESYPLKSNSMESLDQGDDGSMGLHGEAAMLILQSVANREGQRVDQTYKTRQGSNESLSAEK